eukprot:Nk52_evm26s2579 gene=Nk52_evmTU26s2579
MQCFGDLNRGMMKNSSISTTLFFIFSLPLLFLTSPASADCGQSDSFAFSLANQVLIPDYFPPREEHIRKALASMSHGMSDAVFATCATGGEANFLRHCHDHGQCYAIGGMTKNECDNKVHDAWWQECESKFAPSHSFARKAREIRRKICTEKRCKLFRRNVAEEGYDNETTAVSSHRQRRFLKKIFKPIGEVIDKVVDKGKRAANKLVVKVKEIAKQGYEVLINGISKTWTRITDCAQHLGCKAIKLHIFIVAEVAFDPVGLCRGACKDTTNIMKNVISAADATDVFVEKNIPVLNDFTVIAEAINKGIATYNQIVNAKNKITEIAKTVTEIAKDPSKIGDIVEDIYSDMKEKVMSQIDVIKDVVEKYTKKEVIEYVTEFAEEKIEEHLEPLLDKANKMVSIESIKEEVFNKFIVPKVEDILAKTLDPEQYVSGKVLDLAKDTFGDVGDATADVFGKLSQQLQKVIKEQNLKLKDVKQLVFDKFTVPQLKERSFKILGKEIPTENMDPIAQEVFQRTKTFNEAIEAMYDQFAKAEVETSFVQLFQYEMDEEDSEFFKSMVMYTDVTSSSLKQYIIDFGGGSQTLAVYMQDIAETADQGIYSDFRDYLIKENWDFPKVREGLFQSYGRSVVIDFYEGIFGQPPDDEEIEAARFVIVEGYETLYSYKRHLVTEYLETALDEVTADILYRDMHGHFEKQALFSKILYMGQSVADIRNDLIGQHGEAGIHENFIDVLGRHATNEELAMYKDKLKNEGWSMRLIRETLVETEAPKILNDTYFEITKNELEYDSAEYQIWEKRLKESGWAISEIKETLILMHLNQNKDYDYIYETFNGFINERQPMLELLESTMAEAESQIAAMVEKLSAISQPNDDSNDWIVTGVNVQLEANGPGTGNLMFGHSSYDQGHNNVLIGEHSKYPEGTKGSIIGGSGNSVTGTYNSIFGGTLNSASGFGSVVLGGVRNKAEGRSTCVVGGLEGVAGGDDKGGQTDGRFNVVVGGHKNCNNAAYSVVAGSLGKCPSYFNHVYGVTK